MAVHSRRFCLLVIVKKYFIHKMIAANGIYIFAALTAK